jgi:hypothetical protein
MTIEATEGCRGCGIADVDDLHIALEVRSPYVGQVPGDGNICATVGIQTRDCWICRVADVHNIEPDVSLRVICEVAAYTQPFWGYVAAGRCRAVAQHNGIGRIGNVDYSQSRSPERLHQRSVRIDVLCR